MAPVDEETWNIILAHPDTKLEPPALAGAIEAFEVQQRVVLPPSHRAFLQKANGGEIGVARIFGVGLGKPLDLLEEIQMMRPYIEGLAQGRVLPFANDWGGGRFCYDLSQCSADADFLVLYWDHEYAEEPEYHSYLWRDYAANFTDFLRKIVSE